MDKIEFESLWPWAASKIAMARQDLAALGDAERLAQAYSECPWLREANHPEPRGSNAMGILGTLCCAGGADAARRFGALIHPTSDTLLEFPALVADLSEREARDTFKAKNPPLAAARFANFHQGLDANPHLATGFGSRLYGSLLACNRGHLFDGLRGEADALWWSQATAHAPEPILRHALHAIQAGETLAHLAEAMRHGRHSPEASVAEGLRVGAALAVLARSWAGQADPAGLDLCGRLLYMETPHSTRANGANRMANDPSAKAAPGRMALAAAMGLTPEPILSALATQATGRFAVLIEARRIETASGAAVSAQPASRL